jgi:hypothetical protein
VRAAVLHYVSQTVVLSSAARPLATSCRCASKKRGPENLYGGPPAPKLMRHQHIRLVLRTREGKVKQLEGSVANQGTSTSCRCEPVQPG